MLPTSKKLKVRCDRSVIYSEEIVKEKIPFIRKKIFKLMKLIKHHKKREVPPLHKIDALELKIKELRRTRIKIMNNLPKSLQPLGLIYDINILGFEQHLTCTRKTILIESSTCFKPSVGKCKCQSLTLKGTPCSRNAVSHDGKFCKMHDPALSSVRKINR